MAPLLNPAEVESFLSLPPEEGLAPRPTEVGALPRESALSEASPPSADADSRAQRLGSRVLRRSSRTVRFGDPGSHSPVPVSVSLGGGIGLGPAFVAEGGVHDEVGAISPS